MSHPLAAIPTLVGETLTQTQSNFIYTSATGGWIHSNDYLDAVEVTAHAVTLTVQVDQSKIVVEIDHGDQIELVENGTVVIGGCVTTPPPADGRAYMLDGVSGEWFPRLRVA